MPLRLTTLGGLPELVEVATGTPYKLSNSKHLVLLAYLLLQREQHTREWLTTFMWGADGAGSMNNALSSLREIMGEGVFPRYAQQILVPPSVVSCDAVEFARLSESDAAAFPEALALYRGPFLEDFNARGASSRLIQWVERRRAEFERMFLEMAARECERCREAGDWRGIEETVEAVLKRVSAWPESESWLSHAAALRDQQSRVDTVAAPAAAQLIEPVIAARPSVPSAPAPVHAPQPRRLLIAVGVGVLAILAAIIFLRAGRGRGEDPRPVVAGAVAEVCAPGAASAQLVDEVFHYGVRVRPGLTFAKRWTLQNTGDCTWDTNFRLHYVGSRGTRLSTTMMDIPLKRPVPPEDTVAFVLQMRAPTEPGRYEEVWELRGAGDRAVEIGDKRQVVAGIKVPLPHYPDCTPGQGSAILLVKKLPDGAVKRP